MEQNSVPTESGELGGVHGEEEAQTMNLRKVFTRDYIEDGGLIPRGYGFAYYEWVSMKAVFYPIPVNLVVNLHRKLHEILVGPSAPKINVLVKRAYMRGRADGYRLLQERLDKETDDFIKERWGRAK